MIYAGYQLMQFPRAIPQIQFNFCPIRPVIIIIGGNFASHEEGIVTIGMGLLRRRRWVRDNIVIANYCVGIYKLINLLRLVFHHLRGRSWCRIRLMMIMMETCLQCSGIAYNSLRHFSSFMPNQLTRCVIAMQRELHCILIADTA